MNDNNTHWYLCVVDVVKEKVLVFDSLPVYPNNIRYSAVANVIKQLDQVLQLVIPNYTPTLINWHIHGVDWAPRQTNGYDCGIFVIKEMHAQFLDHSFKIKV